MLSRRNVALLVLAAVLLGVAAFLFVYMRRAESRSKTNPPAPVVCESCGAEFQVQSNDEDPICPKCGAPAAVRRLYFRCMQCEHVFLAYELDPKKDLAREPGGEWIPRLECSFSPQCPKCGGTTQFIRDMRRQQE